MSFESFIDNLKAKGTEVYTAIEKGAGTGVSGAASSLKELASGAVNNSVTSKISSMLGFGDDDEDKILPNGVQVVPDRTGGYTTQSNVSGMSTKTILVVGGVAVIGAFVIFKMMRKK